MAFVDYVAVFDAGHGLVWGKVLERGGEGVNRERRTGILLTFVLADVTISFFRELCVHGVTSALCVL